MTIQLSKLEQLYLKEEQSILLECLERNELSNYPFDLSKFMLRVEEINDLLKE